MQFKLILWFNEKKRVLDVLKLDVILSQKNLINRHN